QTCIKGRQRQKGCLLRRRAGGLSAFCIIFAYISANNDIYTMEEKQMVKVIMHGCNGKMGQVITRLAAADPEMEIVAGVDMRAQALNDYPVFGDIGECGVEADVVIDFSNAAAVDRLLD